MANRRDHADLRELTITMGRSDIYVNLEKHVALDNGHTLYEAILTDESGSRMILIDKEDIAACLRESVLLGESPA